MKTWKNLIVPVIILAALLGGFIFYSFVIKDRQIADQLESAETVDSGNFLVNFLPEDLAGIHVLNSDGSGYTVSRYETDTEESYSWNYGADNEDVSGYRFSQIKLISFLTQISSCMITDTINQGNDVFTEYGLDKPSVEVRYTLLSGETHTVLFGDPTYEGSGVYCIADDSETVYTTNIEKLTACSSTLLDFLDLSITDVAAEDVDSISFERMEDILYVSAAGPGTQVSEDLSGTAALSKWMITSPFVIGASESFGAVLDSVLALSASSYVDLNPLGYSKYGLDNPGYIFDISLTDLTTIQIMISKEYSGVYYGRTEDSPAVFSMDTALIKGLQTPLIDMIQPYPIYDMPENIKNIEGVFPEGTFSIDMNIAENGKISDDDTLIKVNGVNAKVADKNGRYYFDLLFEGIAYINITDFDFAANPVNTKEISITMTRRDSKQTIIDLAVRDENTYYAFINGEYHGFLVSRGEIYKDNGTDLYEYGAWAAYKRLMEAIDGDSGSGIYVISD